MSNATETKQPVKPAYIAYHVRDREGQSPVFTAIGALWPHKDEKGYNLVLEVPAPSKRITLRLPFEKKE